MKHILVPTDFSPQSEYALKVAAQLAKKFNADIYLLHVLELPLHLATADTGQIPEAIFFMKLAQQKFEKFKAQPYLKDITVHEAVESHKISDGIKKFSEENRIDLVIMGSSGSSGLKEMFVGSNTEKVVRNSDIPVLILKENVDAFRIDNFVYACDFEESSFNAYKNAVEFADNFEAKVHLLYVNTPHLFTTTNETNLKINSYIKKLKPKNYTINIYNDDTVEQGILNFSQSMNANIIGISTHGRSGLDHFFSGSIGEDIANHAIRPVVTFKM